MLLGISLGNWNASLAIAASDDHSPELIANAEGDRFIPTAFHWGHDQLCGTIAKQYALRHPQNTVSLFLPLLGLSTVDDPIVMKWKRFHRRIQLEERDNELYINFPSQSEEAEDNASRSLSITDIVSLYLRYLKSTAETYSGASISGVVLSCQSLHTKQAAQRLRSAAEKADLPLWSILEEPVAAYLGCRFPLSSNPTDDRYFLMIDMGAMATRFTLLAQRSGVFVTVAQHEHADFSGLKLDLLLKDHFAVEFKRKYRLDISESWKSEMKLLYGCEQTKKSLSKTANGFIALDSLHEGLDFNSSIHRLRFEMLCAPALNGLLQAVNSFVDSVQTQVNQVVLIGGLAFIPFVSEKLATLYEIVSSSRSDPVEVFCLGALAEAQTMSKAQGQPATPTSTPQAHLASRDFGLFLYSSPEDDGESTMSVLPVIQQYQPLPVSHILEVDLPPVVDSANLIVVESTLEESEEEEGLVDALGKKWRPISISRLSAIDVEKAEFDVQMKMDIKGVLSVELINRVSGKVVSLID